MNKKFKQIIIPFILLMVFNLGFSNIYDLWDFGVFAPHVGILFIFGLLFGPYGAIGATASNFICDLINGFWLEIAIPSAIFSFAISLLAWRIWYGDFNRDYGITKPSLDNSHKLSLFLFDLLVCATLYSTLHGNILGIFLPQSRIENFYAAQYFMNFVNVSFIFGIICIWIFNKTDLVYTPKTTTRSVNKKAYKIISYLIIILTIINMILLFLPTKSTILIINLIIIAILLYVFLTKPFEYELKEIKEKSISQNVMKIFLITTLVIVIVAIIISFILGSSNLLNLNEFHDIIPTSPILLLANVLIILFFIPTNIILRYVEKNVLQPISSFSEIEEFIHENQKIESGGILNMYSRYIDDENEIGTLAKSYTKLINHNNNYIENIHKIESEKERINAELDIARKIQQSNLPTEPIDTGNYTVNGYSHPAKEVGGDFFDYYEIDSENLAIVIGDASDKGVPAAMLATITQTLIKQLLNSQKDPSQILFQLNNQICENNTETMFITVWLGIYNKTSKTITFSNAGHEPPLIKKDNKYECLKIDSGIVLGIMEDFEFVKEEINLSEEIILYTDGITDANNEENEKYGQNRLLNFFNSKDFENPIPPLLDDINNFTGNMEQFDDMTLLYLRDHHD